MINIIQSKTIKRVSALFIAVILISAANSGLLTAKADTTAPISTETPQQEPVTGQSVTEQSVAAQSVTALPSSASVPGVAAVYSETPAITTTVSLSGVLICENCRKASPVNHMRKCTQMTSCAAAGYGILVAQTDKTYRFVKFDSAEDAKIPEFISALETAGVTKYLSVVVTGTYTSEKITAPGGASYDGFNVSSIVFDATHSAFEKNAVSIENNNITFADIDNQVYTGSEIKPALNIKDGEYTLGTSDFTATFSNNIEAGTATVTINGIGAFYKGTITKTFRIVKDPAILANTVKQGISYEKPQLGSQFHELKITSLEQASADYTKVNQEIKKYISTSDYQVTQSLSFDIEPLDETGNAVALHDNEYIVIKIPVPEGYDQSKVVVYHVADNGEVQVVADASDVLDGIIVISARSFSPYVVAEVSKATAQFADKYASVKTSETTVASDVTPSGIVTAEVSAQSAETANSPATGDNNEAGAYSMIISLALFFIILSHRKKSEIIYKKKNIF